MSDLVYRRNLLALSTRNPGLAARLDGTEPDPRLRIQPARSGAPVPVYALAEREAAFHSLMDPRREGERLAAVQAPGGFVVALGLGGGYGLGPFLASSATTGVLVVEYRASLLRALLEELDLSELFVDGRVSLVLDPEPGELEAALLSSYLPPLAGDIRTVPLRGRVDLDPERFAGAAASIRAVLSRISDDYSVQAFFGKLWFRNAVRNLFIAERPAAALPPIRKAAVTAAGPSLEAGLPALREARDKGAFLIATDTSLPALVGA
ncbi:MAG: motility associated factor glycosyltransferase family protein, partial [Spirochaetaceae bacterium]|nr:motility associated factor glycosyltransferase family protein [Spirochaetaceae bacterium]